jgi:hypothetical protein
MLTGAFSCLCDGTLRNIAVEKTYLIRKHSPMLLLIKEHHQFEYENHYKLKIRALFYGFNILKIKWSLHEHI